MRAAPVAGVGGVSSPVGRSTSGPSLDRAYIDRWIDELGLRAIEVGVRRVNPDLEEGDAWIPQERLELASLIAAYTLNGAIAGDLEHETGSITVGKSADLIVLDTDLFSVPSARISDARVDLTVFEGRVVYRR